MQPVELKSENFALLKLLDKIDKCRLDYDQAVANNQHRKAADFLKQIRRLVSKVDQLVQDRESDFQAGRIRKNENSTSTKK